MNRCLDIIFLIICILITAAILSSGLGGAIDNRLSNIASRSSVYTITECQPIENVGDANITALHNVR